MRKITAAVAFALAVATAGYADEGKHDHEHAMKPASKEFERMKQMVGTWKGTSEMGEGKKMDAEINYKLTSGGSAIVETLSPGTPHEMVSVYHDEGGKLAMTHYCAMGNQPHMKLTKSDDKAFSLELEKGKGIDPKKEDHMHAVTMSWQDKDHVTQTWTSFKGGKQEPGAAVFTLARTDEGKK